MKKLTIIIINLDARQGIEIEEQVKEYARSQNMSVDIQAVPSHKVREALDDAAGRKPDRLVVAGGDGSVSAAVNRLVGSNTTLGIIPAGTTNNFARSVGIPMGIEEAIAAALAGREISVTVGRVNDRYFCNTVTIGLSALAVTHTNASRKKILGRAEYLIEAIKYFFNHDHFSCELTLDGEKQRFTSHQIIIANSSYQAGVAIAPEHLIQDPHLLVTALAINQNRWQYVLDILRLPLGLSKRTKHTFTATAKNIEVTTHPAQPVEADGENLGKVPVTLSLAPHTMQVVVPE